MYISKSFIPILKNNPSEAKIKSHQLMLRVGMIKQSSAGIYSWLPLGFKVMKKIEQIVREEQNKIGGEDTGSPENPKMLKKFIYCTGITTVIFMIIYLLIKYEYLNLRYIIS